MPTTCGSSADWQPAAHQVALGEGMRKGEVPLDDEVLWEEVVVLLLLLLKPGLWLQEHASVPPSRFPSRTWAPFVF